METMTAMSLTWEAEGGDLIRCHISAPAQTEYLVDQFDGTILITTARAEHLQAWAAGTEQNAVYPVDNLDRHLPGEIKRISLWRDPWGIWAWVYQVGRSNDDPLLLGPGLDTNTLGYLLTIAAATLTEPALF